MLNRLVNIINASSTQVTNSYLLVRDYVVADLDCLSSLDSQQCINSFNIEGNTVICTDLKIGDTVTVEFSLLHLSSIGYFETLDSFILKHQYTISQQPYYVREINCFDVDENVILDTFKSVISLINGIKGIAKHCYSEAGDDFALVIRDDKALLLSFQYSATEILSVSATDSVNICSVNRILQGDDPKEKIILANELIDFLISIDERNRFQFLLSHIDDFEERYRNAYAYYIRDFSYNKLKTELDNAALEYVRKIQSLINDAQTKLIAIPTAFVLAIANIDFDKIISNKNIGIICSLFIFSWLLDLFIKNQKSALGFIVHNISQYKNSFSTHQNEVVSGSFVIVDDEITKQKTRLCTVHWITWSVPVVLLIILILIHYKTVLCLIFQK